MNLTRLLSRFPSMIPVLVLLAGCARLSFQVQVEPASLPELDQAAVMERLAGALRFPTVSYSETAPTESAAFLALNAYLAEAFPSVHNHLQREIVNDYSLLYTWTGSDPALEPLLLLGHTDVVPADSVAWRTPPFAGVIHDNTVIGRGTLDDKSCVLGILEAVEYLLQQNFQPERTVLLAFGHDEEIGGSRG
ncbi:MAG: M20/M25/M40 family metallo-hydrolase, partial [Candidatus Neomarinimicrobiota bacterium]